MFAKASFFPRILLGLLCWSWPLVSCAGGSDAAAASAWLLQAFLLLVALLLLLLGLALATRLVVWPRWNSLPGILAMLLVAGGGLFVLCVVVVLSAQN